LSEAIAPCMRRLRSFMSNVVVAMVLSAIRAVAFAAYPNRQPTVVK